MAKYNRNSGNPWTRHEISQLRKMIDKDTPTKMISRRLGRTTDAIYKKASEKNISLRGTKKKKK